MADVLDWVLIIGFGWWAWALAKSKRRDEVGWAMVAAVAFFVPGYAMQQVVFPALARSTGWPEAWQKPSGFIVGALCALAVDLYLTLFVKPLAVPEATPAAKPAEEAAAPLPEREPAPEPAAPTDYAALARRFWPVLAALAAFGATFLPLLWLKAQPAAGERGAVPDPLATARYFVVPLILGTLAWRLRGRVAEGILAGLFTLMFVPAIEWMFWRWGRGSSYYSHGYLIPFVVVWLVWMSRQRLAKMEASDDFRVGGLLALVGGLLLLVSGTFIRAYTIQGIAFVVVLCGLVFFLYGKAISKLLLFPLLFTITMIPMPMQVVEGLTFNLKMFAAAASVWVVDALQGLGIHNYIVIQDGSYIRWETSLGVMDNIIVGDVCSGLRSLIALLAFGALFAYIAKLSLARKLLLFAAAVPISLLANMWRIVTLTFVACRWGSGETHGWVHDFTGYGIFAVAFVLFFAFERLLRRFEPAAGAAEAS